ncbi:MAG TPA: hypothetical protein VFW41_02535 [Gaiellaceae bacterium]|nr:hypothetical protein [Gaiellaceae bacterium]
MRWIPAILAAGLIAIACIAIGFVPWAIALFAGASFAGARLATRKNVLAGVLAGLLVPPFLFVVLFLAGGGGH